MANLCGSLIEPRVPSKSLAKKFRSKTSLLPTRTRFVFPSCRSLGRLCRYRREMVTDTTAAATMMSCFQGCWKREHEPGKYHIRNVHGRGMTRKICPRRASTTAGCDIDADNRQAPLPQHSRVPRQPTPRAVFKPMSVLYVSLQSRREHSRHDLSF